jgi:transposase-like protein
MSAMMEEEIKRWTMRRKSQLVLEIIQGKKTISEASRQLDLPPSEIENWVDEGKHSLENALRRKPEDMREQYERQIKDLQPVACSRRASADGLPSMRLPSCPS